MTYQLAINLNNLTDNDDTNDEQALQFLNIFIKSIMSDRKLVEMGRNAQFYYPENNDFNQTV